MIKYTLRLATLSATLSILAVLLPAMAGAVTVFTADGQTPLAAESLTPPAHRTAVLFVHGHDPDPQASAPNYKKNFHDTLAGLTSFKQTLDLPENGCLGIEPYYIHFGDTPDDHRRSIDIDAAEIGAAIELILDHHRLAEPDNPDLKVAVIAYSKGTLSTRKYLRDLHAAGAPIPVSEFIAIAPPNHGLRWPGLDTRPEQLSARQLNNGHNYFCNPFDDASVDFIENLNAPPPGTPDPSQAWEAPGSRPDGAPVGEGVLYVAIYAAGNGDFVGGSTVSNDCMGRVLARNLAPDAVNIDTIQVPTAPPSDSIPSYIEPFLTQETRDKFARHQNTVHHREVVFHALYSVVHHQTPPPGITIAGDVPVVPPPAGGSPGAAVALLFDTSGSMSWSHGGAPGVEESRRRLTLARRAAVPFLDMLAFFNPCHAAFGIVRFPRQPLSGCTGEVLTPLTTATPAAVDTATQTTIAGLQAAGSTPLLAGLTAAAAVLGDEARKAIVLLSDGFHNCPSASGIDDIRSVADQLAAASVRTYAIGFGQPAEVPHDLLAELAGDTGGYYDVTTAPGFDPAAWDPATALQAAYKSILVDALELEAAADPAGLIRPGERRSHEVAITEHDRKVAFYVSWATPGQHRVRLAIRSSDGRELPLDPAADGIHLRQGDTFSLVTIDAAFLRVPGRVAPEPWTLELRLADASKGRAEPYQWSVLTDSGLALRAGVQGKPLRTGSALTLTARLTASGRPLAGPASVRVRVARPIEGLGNWLAAASVSPAELARVPEQRSQEPLTPLMRKVLFLAEQGGGRQFPGRRVVDTLTLYDDGAKGDAAAGDGVFTGRLEGTNIPGTYAFEFIASGRTAGGIAFERSHRVERHIGVSTESIAAVATRLPATVKGDLYEISLRPADAFGNLLGPGQAHQILWESGLGEFPEPVVDHLDGTYSRRLQLPEGSDPAAVGLGLVVGNTPFRPGLAELLTPGPPASVGWMVILLALLTGALILLLKGERR